MLCLLLTCSKLVICYNELEARPQLRKYAIASESNTVSSCMICEQGDSDLKNLVRLLPCNALGRVERFPLARLVICLDLKKDSLRYDTEHVGDCNDWLSQSLCGKVDAPDCLECKGNAACHHGNNFVPPERIKPVSTFKTFFFKLLGHLHCIWMSSFSPAHHTPSPLTERKTVVGDRRCYAVLSRYVYGLGRIHELFVLRQLSVQFSSFYIVFKFSSQSQGLQVIEDKVIK